MRKWGAKKEGCGRPELDLNLMWGTMTASVFLPCHGKTAHAPRRNRAGGPACRALDQWFSTPGSVPQGLRFFKRCTVINSFTVLLESITDPQPSKSDLPHMSLRSNYMFNMVPFVYLLLVFLFLLFVTFFVCHQFTSI